MLRFRSPRSLAGALVLAGCASSSQNLVTYEKAPAPAAAPAAGGAADHARKGDECWDKRAERAQLDCAIAAWKQAAEADPKAWQVWAKLSRAQFLLADGFVRFERARRAEGQKVDENDPYLRAHQEGVRFAKLAMQHASAEFARKFELGTPLEDAVGVLGKEHVPAMYWFASNFGRWANEMGTDKVLLYKDLIRKVMQRCLELDPDYFYAGPHRYFGAFFAKAPAFAGGDMDKAKEHFETAIRMAPGYLGTYGLYAEFYAVKQQDRDLFRQQLRHVIDADAGQLPEVAVENSIEKKKAQDLLGREAELF